MASSALISDTQPWKDLKAHVDDVKKAHLRDLLSDDKRCQSMLVEFDDILLDYARQQATPETIQKLFELAEAASLKEKINRMYSGEHINSTENRSVLHVALHASRDVVIESDGKNVVPEVWKVLDKIQDFSERVRNGCWCYREGFEGRCCSWYWGKLLRSTVCTHCTSNRFLRGASSIDQHFYSQPFESNIPVLLGLLSIWNVSFLGYPARAILPYSQALEKFAPHIQQASMESNGKGVSIDGVPLPFEAGEIDFGEPGTNGQHSFYQLIHQGRVIPCDFIGVVKSQQPVFLKGEVVSNHDELMSNYFAQSDALAYGKTAEQLQKENVSPHLIPHKTFSGNRPSLSLLLPSLNAYNIGQLLAIYEHRIAVEGFIWGINSFDQWGVELGKSLATQVRKQLNASRTKGEPIQGFNFSTTTMLTRYLQASSDVPADLSTVLPKI
ncbi:glucose-6-phosphate isomerase, cytosolic 2 [Glycine max]|uniref:glucose-6-phosphate isomerase, cytosolic 2 n=1 Tax=Glycine max TaxID=3847 RepID=UPI00071936D7|nr:glucose-6-phosphate isomerase, cytosolic 2 [Glycine max]|eukprot:XP_014632409.1 glucose-6-phosphate isomerase, cytosolic 2 [Glycine max]